MTFAAQVRRTAVAAAVLFGLGLAALGAGRAVTGAMPGGLWAVIAQAGTAAGAVLFVFGVLGRSVQRVLWLRAIRDSTLALGGRRYRDYLLDGPLRGFWIWWLHVDAAGNDRDRD